MKPLSALEDATLRTVLGHAGEMEGWLDLTRVSSNTGRMLSDVRQAVARLVRRGSLHVDENAPNTERWIRFILPDMDPSATETPPRPAP